MIVSIQSAHVSEVYTTPQNNHDVLLCRCAALPLCTTQCIAVLLPCAVAPAQLVVVVVAPVTCISHSYNEHRQRKLGRRHQS
jgi:hypothetical protein